MYLNSIKPNARERSTNLPPDLRVSDLAPDVFILLPICGQFQDDFLPIDLHNSINVINLCLDKAR